MIEKTKYQITCDVKNCKNTAEYCFSVKGRIGKVHLCPCCVKQLGADCGKIYTPKSPKNAIKKAMEDKTVKEI